MVENICPSVSPRIISKVITDYSLITSDIGLASAIVGIVVILSLEQCLHLGNGSVKLKPLPVDGLRYPLRVDSRVVQPSAYCIDRVFLRSE